MFQDQKQGIKNKIGAYGEEITARYLKRQGFQLLDRNYLKKWGEIDLVTRDTLGTVHFVEVKTVSYETRKRLNEALSHETWRPEEQVHHFKLKKLYRVIESWLLEHEFDGEWQIDVAAVRVVPHEKYATIKIIENIIEG